MRKLHTVLLAAGVVLAAAPALAEVKIALDSPPNMERAGSYVWAHTFAEYLKSKGMDVKEYARGSLGGEAEKLDQVSQGLLEVSMSDLKSAGKIDKLVFGAALPYLFQDAAHMDRAVAAAGLMDKINAAVTKNGVRVLAITTVGPGTGIFNTKKPVHKAADMADLRMRALDESQIALFKAWGTTGTIVSWKEVPNALQTGVANGYLNPVFVPVMFGHTDFIKFFTDAKVTQSARLALASEDWYRGLSDAQRKIVDDGAAAATKANRDWLKRTEPKMMDEVKAAGVAVVELTPEARAEFQSLSKAVYADGVLTPEQVKIWVDAADKAR
ncbi:MAG: TRAP transporter substrate-binding protein [Hyphomicrobiales bacterium]|nr:TRAP transporter substrate-binding protein [Hyphomicrobiales bacterium]MCP5372317.1 TRAP transporter substrate-binding protein [Hyphomicrobiales bacterium]